MRTSGGGGSTRAQRENVASATARRASHAVASHPLSPTKFRKNPTVRLGFLLSASEKRMRTSGVEVRPERSERTLLQQRPAGRATQWRVILWHRPNSEKPNRKVGFFVFCLCLTCPLCTIPQRGEPDRPDTNETGQWRLKSSLSSLLTASSLFCEIFHCIFYI